MAPIRTALIGLSGNAKTSWAANAHLPYLLSERGRAKYQIVALLNSSVESAKNAINLFSLDPGTKAYGNPEDLAQDPDVDLVVCATRVDIHHKSTLPSVIAGKRAFIEWPLAQDSKHAQELADAAAKHGTKTLVGHQGRFAPVIVKLKQLLDSGLIGKVLSSEIRAFGGTHDREKVAQGLSYFLDRAVGGNILTIGFAHTFDATQFVLGDLQNPTANFQLQRPEAKLVDSKGEVTGTVTSDMPDLITVNGSLNQSETVQQNATYSFRLRRGQPFKSEPAFVWAINGEKGEVRLTAVGGPSLHAAAEPKDVTLEVHDFATDAVEKFDWSPEEWQNELPILSRNIGTLYDKYADGQDDLHDGLPSFHTALHRHKQLDELISQWKA